MVEALAPGSVVVDLAAERGGNCEVTRAGENIVHHGVNGPRTAQFAPPRFPTTPPALRQEYFDVSAITGEGGQLKLDLEDEIVRQTLVARDGKVVRA